MRAFIKLNFNTMLYLLGVIVIVFFGCWTILANIIVLSEGTFVDLYNSTYIAVIASIVVFLFFAFEYQSRPVRFFIKDETNAYQRPEPGNVWIHLLVGACLSAIFAFGKNYFVFWIMTILYLGIAFWHGRHAPDLQFHEASSHRLNYLAFVLAVVLAVSAAVFINRPNDDQTLSINMAVSVLDEPASPIYASDALHNIPGAYFLPTYRVHTFELLAALLSRVLHVDEPIKIFHFLLAPLFTVFAVCAAGICFQRLLPELWGAATLFLGVVLLVFRETYIIYGNFAFVRMFEGKSIFITAIIPLIIVYAIDFFAEPRLSKWLLLALAQICAVGFTANSLYIGPMVAGLTLLACWHPSFQATRRVILGLLASFYPVLTGLVIRFIIIRNGLSIEEFQKFIPIDSAAKLLLGKGIMLWFWLFGLISSWCVIKDRAVRRWMLGFCLVFMLFCMNPFLDEYWGLYITANYLTWRLFWIIPLPLFLSILLAQGVANGFEHSFGKKVIFIFIALTLTFTLMIGRPWKEPRALSELGIGLKVPQPEYEIARKLNEITVMGDSILAPENISAWIPTFRMHAYPVVARAHYTEGLLAVFANQIDTEDLKERLALAEYVNGASSDNQHSEVLLMRWLDKEKIASVAVPLNFSRRMEITQILADAGFDGFEYQGYLIFNR